MIATTLRGPRASDSTLSLVRTARLQHLPECGGECVRLPLAKLLAWDDRVNRAERDAVAAAVADVLENDQLVLGLDDRLRRAHELAYAAAHAVRADDVRQRALARRCSAASGHPQATATANSVGMAAAPLKNSWKVWLKR